MEPVTVIEGTALPIDRSDVDTDQVIPAEYLKRIERAGFGPFLFAEWRKDPNFVINDPRYAGASIMIAGENFGSGSSREHAPWAIEDAGFKAVIAPSFADIFRNNCTKIGLLPVVLPEDDVKALMAAGEAEVDLEALEVRFAGRTVPFALDEERRRRLLEGLDDIAVTLLDEDEISRFEAERERSGPVTTSL